MEFRKYLHVERVGTSETEGIELGKCFVFPKLDGTAGSVFLKDSQVIATSRNRVLDFENDNNGFCKFISEQENIKDFLIKNDNIILYGEWLVPHSLKTYREDAWREFYVYDVFDCLTGEYVNYDEYKKVLDEGQIKYVPALSVIINGNEEKFRHECQNNTFLIKGNSGVGEGIVIKNYSFKNKFGNVVWAKMITKTFKEKHEKAMGATVKVFKEHLEAKIVDKYVTQHLVEKNIAKIKNEEGGWSSKYIPRLLNSVYYDLIKEEMWDIVKTNKNPTIDFKRLFSFTVGRVKILATEMFC